jgi:plasmid stability protein
VKTKKTPLTVRRCPTEVHEALKASAAANHRSLNGEALTWLEKQAAAVQKPVMGKEAAAILRKWHKSLSKKDHLEIADRIEEARRRMNNEHLH